MNSRNRNIISVAFLFTGIIIGISFLLLKRHSSSIPEIISLTNSVLSPTISTEKKDITLSIIFNNAHSTPTIPSDSEIVLLATGDVMPARSVNTRTQQRGDYTWAFQPTAEVLRKPDMTLINLETPLLDPCPSTDEGMKFCAPTKHIQGLTYAGIDIVNVANNHTENYGSEGVSQTVGLLQANGMGVTGVGVPYVKTVKGITFGFLGYNDIVTGQGLISTYESEQMRSDIIALKKRADVVVVSFHWGVEYTRQPTSRQRMIAHQAVDAGADVIIGNHPHWIQPVEIYKDKVIVYSHGNFIFDQMWSEETRIGIVGTYVFSGKHLVDVIFTPVRIYDYGQPAPLPVAEAQSILSMLETESKILSTVSADFP